jgi:hypothetical protein
MEMGKTERKVGEGQKEVLLLEGWKKIPPSS